MNRLIDFRNGLKGIFKSAAALLLGSTVFAVNNSALADKDWQWPWHPHHPPVRARG